MLKIKLSQVNIAYSAFMLILLSLPFTIAAQELQLTQNNVKIFTQPGEKALASLFKISGISYQLENEQTFENKYWIKIGINGWIWKNSTNYKTGKKLVVTLAAKENFRISPNKTPLAELKFKTPLRVIQVQKKWLKVKFIGWIEASQSNYSIPVLEEPQPLEKPELMQQIAADIEADINTTKTSNTEVASNQEEPSRNQLEQSRLTKTKDLNSTTQNIDNKEFSNIQNSQQSTSLQLLNLIKNNLLLVILAVFILLIIVIFFSQMIFSRQLSRQLFNHLSQQKMEQDNKLTELILELQNNLAIQLNSNLGPLHDSTVRGLEKNKGDIALLIERRMADINEKLLNNLSSMRLNMSESLNHSTRSQAQAFSNFQNQFSKSVDLSLKRNIDSLNKMFNDLRQSTDQHMQEINERVETRLKKGFEQTNQIFIDIKERLNQIDQAQQRISELSNNVVSLQKTLDNKGARGAFGEVQLIEIVKDMIPDKFCKFQQTLSNEKRPDCIILLPPPTGQLIIDAKFPLENYKLMFNKEISDIDKNNAALLFKRDIKKHIKDISEKYIIPGETADGAVMFIPSEAVFAEIHAHHPDLVKQAQLKRVWMASPTTLMALLTTARAVLADDERSKQAKIIHEHLNALAIEFNRFTKRMDDLAKHINMAYDDVNKINISAKKITDKFEQIENSDLDELENSEQIAIQTRVSA